MTAVIRVKRKITEEPLDAVVINCKRRKIHQNENEQADDSISAVIKFAGTISNHDDSITAHIKKITIEEAKESFKKHIPNIKAKQRNETKLESQNNRFKVVNCSRELEDLNNQRNSEVIEKHVTVLDIESNTNAVSDSSSKVNSEVSKYVYDLYYAGDVDDMVIDEMVSIHPFNELLDYGPGQNGTAELQYSDDDSDDSNIENCYKNDYPDSDNSINEVDMLGAMRNMDLGDTLSDDEGEDGFVYSIDSEAAGFEEDVDESDEHRYGERYARYKARVTRELNEDSDDEVCYEDFYDDGEYSCDSN